MKQFTMPHTEITAPQVVLGLMRIAEKSDEEIRTLVGAARNAGIDFIDHADAYGGQLHECERRFAQALKLSPSERDELTIQTKAGIVPDGPYFDFSYEHIIESVEGSLKALDTDRSTSCCCTAPTPWWSRRRWPAPSTSCTPQARCCTSASPTTPRARSTC